MTSGLIPVVLIVSDFSSLLLWLLEKRAIRIKDTQWLGKAVAGLGCPQHSEASRRDIFCDDLFRFGHSCWSPCRPPGGATWVRAGPRFSPKPPSAHLEWWNRISSSWLSYNTQLFVSRSLGDMNTYFCTQMLDYWPKNPLPQHTHLVFFLLRYWGIELWASCFQCRLSYHLSQASSLQRPDFLSC